MTQAREGLVFVEKKVIGRIENGIFIQRITDRHVFRQQNTKGMDANVYYRLAPICHTWRLVFKHTKQILSLPFGKIPQVGQLIDTGAGQQYLVKFTDFNEDQAILQKALF